VRWRGAEPCGQWQQRTTGPTWHPQSEPHHLLCPLPLPSPAMLWWRSDLPSPHAPPILSTGLISLARRAAEGGANKRAALGKAQLERAICPLLNMSVSDLPDELWACILELSAGSATLGLRFCASTLPSGRASSPLPQLPLLVPIPHPSRNRLSPRFINKAKHGRTDTR
jgi:hypothetical protein